MGRHRRVAGWIASWALIAISCESPERLRTHTYRFDPPVDPAASEEYQKAYAAEYGAWFFRRLLYGSDETLAGPPRRRFIRPSPARGAVSVRDTMLSHQRLEVYLQSIAGAEVDLSRLDPGVVYVFRANLFEAPARDYREAHIRAGYVQRLASDLGPLLQLPEKSDAVAEWSRHCVIYDRWQGALDFYCAPPRWPEARSFIEKLAPPEAFFSYDTLFDPSNVALYHRRAIDQLIEGNSAASRWKGTIPSLEEAASLSGAKLQQALQPYEDIVATLLLARDCPTCDLKPLLPDSPDSPQPCPREEMLFLARLLSAQSLALERSGRPQEALESALTLLKMGHDWNQGPLAYRRLGAEMVALGGRSVKRLLSQPRSRGFYQQTADEVLKFSPGNAPGDPEAFKEAVEPYHFEARFEALPIQEDFHRRVEEAFVQSQVASVQSQILRLHALALLHQLDRGVYPETLEALASEDTASLPADPFGEGPLSYVATGREPQIYSYGPDRRDNYGSLLYDPTNGVLSSGDIYFP